jgi:hypothetical protein
LVLKVSGKVAPEMVNPVPSTVAALTTTGKVPVEVSVTVCVAGEFRFTLPNEIVVALKLNKVVPVPSCRAKVFDAEPALAVKVTVAPLLTAVTVALKLPLVVPDATVTDAGTVTELLLLARLTANPPLAAAALRVTVQLSVPAPVIEPFAQVRPVSTGTPVPLRLTAVEVPVDELLVSVRAPVAAPAAVGSNCTVRAAVCP